jgi:hypothetical protein
MTYIFELHCPRCRAESQFVGTRHYLPSYHCEPCRITDASRIEVDVVRVHVLQSKEQTS